MANLPPYLFAEIDRKKAAKEAQGIDVISLGIGDPDTPTPEHIVDAMATAIRNPANHRYPSYVGAPRYRAALRDYLVTLEALESAQLVQPEDPYSERPVLAQQRLAAVTTADEVSLARMKEAVERFTAADRNPFIEPDGPNWYRGAALCNECSEADVLDPFLATVGVRRLVIGHTVARDTRVASRFEGRVVKLDAGMNRAAYRGRPAALTLDQGGARVSYADDRAPPTEIPAEALYVASPSLDDARVAEILANGTVTVGGPRSPGIVEVSVEHGGQKVPGIFSATTRDDARRELAAHRVDRLLRLGLVPATVEREVQGQRGVLQARPDRTVTLADVQRDKLRVGGWCALEPQYELMYGFDGLIGNEARTADRILYDDAWMLLLTGHGQSFGTARTLPSHLQARAPSPGPEFRRRLASLDDATLAAALGDLVTPRERKAMLVRRDALLAPAAAAARR